MTKRKSSALDALLDVGAQLPRPRRAYEGYGKKRRVERQLQREEVLAEIPWAGAANIDEPLAVLMPTPAEEPWRGEPIPYEDYNYEPPPLEPQETTAGQTAAISTPINRRKSKRVIASESSSESDTEEAPVQRQPGLRVGPRSRGIYNTGQRRAARQAISGNMRDFLSDLQALYGVNYFQSANVYLRDRTLEKMILKKAASIASKSNRETVTIKDLKGALILIGRGDDFNWDIRKKKGNETLFNRSFRRTFSHLQRTPRTFGGFKLSRLQYMADPQDVINRVGLGVNVRGDNDIV